MHSPTEPTPVAARHPLFRASDGASASAVELSRTLQVVSHADLVLTTTGVNAAAGEPQLRVDLVNRVFNVAVAALALAILSPVLLLVALVVKLSSPGPILYVQTRVGLDRRGRRGRGSFDRRIRDIGGRPFVIYKFRSMRVDAEKGSGAVWATQGDTRVTPVGRVIRKLRLDELPQLINVIKGDMNIVGPRPERPSIFATLNEQIEQYAERQRARPGITGWAQINQAYDSCLDDVKEKVRYDLEYLQRQGVTEDLKIMLRTVPVMLFRKGAL